MQLEKGEYDEDGEGFVYSGGRIARLQSKLHENTP